MRLAGALLVVAACTPDIASGSYLCGPNSLCPDGQVCNGPDNTCVLPSAAQPFACTAGVFQEPDDTSAQAHAIENLECVSVPFTDENCMLVGDSEDWVKFQAPSVCAAVKVTARVSFPLAFERLSLELWDLDHDMKLAEDIECPSSGEVGEEIRCIDQTLVPGTSYGFKVRPAGDGDCEGDCRYNRYTLRLQLATP